MKYSQNDEQEHIIKRFSSAPAGRFLDLGAYDGRTFSNTRALAQLGWGGVLVEPSPQCFLGLMHTYAGRSDCQLVNVAACGVAGRIILFHDSGGACATTDQGHFEKWKPYTADYREIYVASVPVKSLIRTFPGPYPFISIDTEGNDWEILQELDLRGLKTEMICVEFGAHRQQILDYLFVYGFKPIYENGENILAEIQ